jgi:hypothetical protein
MSEPPANRRPVVLALGALALVAAAVVLWLSLGRGKDDAPGEVRRDGSAGTAAAPTPPPSLPTPPPGDTTDRAGQPVVSDNERTGSRPGPGDPPRETIVNGVRVRDHRKNPVPIDLPPNLHPPDSRKLQSETVAAINRKVFAVVGECMSDVPREARGANPRLDGQVVVAVKNKQLAVTGSTMQLRDVVGASVDATRLCMEQKAVGLTVPADELDVEGYAISLSYALP